MKTFGKTCAYTNTTSRSSEAEENLHSTSSVSKAGYSLAFKNTKNRWGQESCGFQ